MSEPTAEAGPIDAFGDQQDPQVAELKARLEQQEARFKQLQELVITSLQPTPSPKPQPYLSYLDEQGRSVLPPTFRVAPPPGLLTCPDIFEIAGVPAYDKLVREHREAASHEFKTLYCAAAHLTGAVEAVRDYCFEEADYPLPELHRTLEAVAYILTRRMDQVAAKGHPDSKFAAVLQEEGQDLLSEVHLFNTTHLQQQRTFRETVTSKTILQTAKSRADEVSKKKPSPLPRSKAKAKDQ